jgi:hypothetical protein
MSVLSRKYIGTCTGALLFVVSACQLVRAGWPLRYAYRDIIYHFLVVNQAWVGMVGAVAAWLLLLYFLVLDGDR